MTNEQIKAAIKAKGYTIKAFAEVLSVSYDSLRQALAGTKPLTEQLRRHIMLALQATQGQSGQRVSVPVSLTLPPEIWQAIDTAAAAQGTTPERYTEQLCRKLAQDISQGLIIGRTISHQ